jgi:Ala-tRNA(Pro) deacylase
LAGSVAGTILPFSFNSALEVIADPALLEQDELYFNAARLDRSIVIKTRDYMAIAKPRLERIAEGDENVPMPAYGDKPPDTTK